MREGYCKVARERHALHIPPLTSCCYCCNVNYNASHWSLGMECAEGGRTKGKPTFSLAILPVFNTVTLTGNPLPTTTVTS